MGLRSSSLMYLIPFTHTAEIVFGESQFLIGEIGFFSAQFHFRSYADPVLFPTFSGNMKEPGSECFIVSREGGLRECWGGTGKCHEVQWECSRNVQALQSYVRGGGAGISESSHKKCCSGTEWEFWKRQ